LPESITAESQRIQFRSGETETCLTNHCNTIRCTSKRNLSSSWAVFVNTSSFALFNSN